MGSIHTEAFAHGVAFDTRGFCCGCVVAIGTYCRGGLPETCHCLLCAGYGFLLAGTLFCEGFLACLPFRLDARLFFTLLTNEFFLCRLALGILFALLGKSEKVLIVLLHHQVVVRRS